MKDDELKLKCTVHPWIEIDQIDICGCKQESDCRIWLKTAIEISKKELVEFLENIDKNWNDNLAIPSREQLDKNVECFEITIRKVMKEK